MANIPVKWSETSPANEDIQRICDEVKTQVEKKTGKKYGTFRAIEYRSLSQFQYVAGTSFLIKVHVGSDNYLIIGVFQNLMDLKCEVNRVEECHKDDPIVIPKGN